MATDIRIRPLRPDDVAAAEVVAWDALQVYVPAEQMPADDDLRRRRARGRISHVRRTDPGGAWLAERGGKVVGVALAILREGIWGLSLLAVAGDQQGRGIGSQLLAEALAYGHDARGGIILSSVDPRAMRSYARAGFALRPCICASGPVDRSRLPSGLRARPGDPADDRATCDAASRAVRGAAHGPDLSTMVELGGDLVVIDGKGFALRRDGEVLVLAAHDEDTARDLLWSILAAVPPSVAAQVDFITAEQGWAVDVALAAGLALHPDGPVCVRGVMGPMAPYLPNGAFL
jgi:GNAT superfamily N-acetyltransferase